VTTRHQREFESHWRMGFGGLSLLVLLFLPGQTALAGHKVAAAYRSFAGLGALFAPDTAIEDGAHDRARWG
jgi:hypothetical protein